MARYWVAVADGNWADNNNWSSTSGGASGASYPVAGDDVYFDSGSSKVCTLNADAACATITATNPGTLTLGTYTLTCSGACAIGGTGTDTSRFIVTIGTSAGDGFKVGSFTQSNAYGVITPDNTSAKMQCGGNFTATAGALFTTLSRINFRQTGSGTFEHTANLYPYSFILDAGATITCPGDATLGSINTQVCTINGTIALNNGSSSKVMIGTSAAGTLTFGASSDITSTSSSNDLVWYMDKGATIVNNRVTAFSYGGLFRNAGTGRDNLTIPAFNVPNATVRFQMDAVSGRTRVLSAGTLTCLSLQHMGIDTFTSYFDLASYNPNIVVGDGISMNYTGGITYTVVWQKGTGTITLDGSSGTHNIDFGSNTNSVEDIIINAGTATKTIVNSFSCDSLTITAGTLSNSNNKNITVREAVDFDSTGTSAGTYTRGASGTFTLAGTSGSNNINFRGQSVRDLVVNSGTATKVLLANGTCDTLTITAGILDCSTYTLTGTGAFSIANGAKIITANANGLVHASGSLTGFSGYTYTDGCIIETQESITFDGTVMPSSANINYILNSTGKTDTLSANYDAKTLTITAGTFDISTYNLATGAILVQNGGTFKGGTSSDTGATCTSITWQSGGKREWQNGTKINCSGDWIEVDENITTSAYKGIVTLAGNGNLAKPNLANTFNSFTINAGVITTVTSTLCYISRTAGGNTTINGTLAIGTNKAFIGSGTGTISFGAAGDFTTSGNGALVFYALSTAVFVNSRATAFSGLRVEVFDNSYVDGLCLPAWDFSNADVVVTGARNSGLTRVIKAGDLYCKNLTFVPNDANTFTVVCTANPNFYVSGNITINETSAAVTYTKGTGNYYLTSSASGTTKTLDWSGKAVEDIVVNTSTSGDAKQLINNVTTDSLTITAGNFLMLTHSLTSIGAVSVTGTLTMGTSAGTGLTAAGITFNTGSTKAWVTGSVINNSSDYIEPSSGFTGTQTTGKYTQTGNGSIQTDSASTSYFYEFTVNAGVTATALSSACYLTRDTSNATTINGTLNINSKTVYIGHQAAGSTTIGVNGDITGAGTLNTLFSSANLTNNRLTAFSFTGDFQNFTFNKNNLYLPAWNFSNANVSIYGFSSGNYTRYLSAGTLYCKSFSLIHQLNGDFVADLSTYNPTIEVTESFIIDEGAGSITFNSSSNPINIKGSSGTHTLNFANKTLANVVFDCAGAIKEMAANATITTFSGLGGTLRSTVAGTQRTITLGNNSTAVSCSFKDIVVANAKMNCKDKVSVDAGSPNSNTNLGNCAGYIFFNDILV